MKWQLQAENIGRAAQDAAQLEFAKLLVSRAESLYDLFEDDNLWKNG